LRLLNLHLERKGSFRSGRSRPEQPSKKPPQNRGDLPDDLSVDAISEVLVACGTSWIAVKDEIAFVQSATAAQVAAIPSENQVEQSLADAAPCLRRRFPRSARLTINDAH